MVIVTHNLAQARRVADNAACFWVKNGVEPWWNRVVASRYSKRRATMPLRLT